MRKPTVKQLEKILNSPDGVYTIVSNPDGSLRTIKGKPRPTIADLERMLDSGESPRIVILPDGRIQKKRGPKPKTILTFKENLGAEYAL